MRTILLLILCAISSETAHAKCETKTAGEMQELLDSSNPHYLLDYDGVEKFTMCKAAVMSKKLTTIDTADALDACKKQALKYAFYDADPKSKDHNRKVSRDCAKADPGIVEEAEKVDHAK